MKISVKHNNTEIVLDDNSDLLQPTAKEVEAMVEKMSLEIQAMQSHEHENVQENKTPDVSNFDLTPNGTTPNTISIWHTLNGDKSTGIVGGYCSNPHWKVFPTAVISEFRD
jgi:hypothetical protein